MIPLWVRGTVLFALVFTAGVGAGILIERSRQRPMTVSTMNPDSAVAALDRRLALDSRQRIIIRDALRRHQAVIDSAWRSLRPGVTAAVDSTQMEIYNALRPEQRPAFMEMMQRSHPGMRIRHDSLR